MIETIISAIALVFFAYLAFDNYRLRARERSFKVEREVMNKCILYFKEECKVHEQEREIADQRICDLSKQLEAINASINDAEQALEAEQRTRVKAALDKLRNAPIAANDAKEGQ